MVGEAVWRGGAGFVASGRLSGDQAWPLQCMSVWS